MRRLVAYLASDLGHRRIAILSGTQRTTTSRERLAGWRDELTARGLPAPDELVVAHIATRAGGEAAAGVLLERGERFTALVCINDLVATGALRALHLAGRRVPQDISVAGMDGIADVSPPDKPLTTLAVDHAAMGRAAGELLLARLNGALAPRLVRRVLPSQLQVGETTGPAPPVPARAGVIHRLGHSQPDSEKEERRSE
jgi:LacI family transcriptional regulator